MNQLGMGEDVIEVYTPAPLRFDGGLRVIKVACGGMHTLALTEGGVLFSWGVNDEGGALPPLWPRVAVAAASVKLAPLLCCPPDRGAGGVEGWVEHS
jgi:hypothetical protein